MVLSCWVKDLKVLTNLFAIKLSNEGHQILKNHHLQQYLKSDHNDFEEYSTEHLPTMLDDGYRMMTLQDIMYVFGSHVHNNIILDLK